MQHHERASDQISQPADRQRMREISQQTGELFESVTVLRPLEEVYAFWRDFSNFPFFMKEIERIDTSEGKLSHWVVKLPRGGEVEWDAAITEEIPNLMLSWKSIDEGVTFQVRQWGSVWFRHAPADRGTIVSLSMQYTLPGGKVSELATKLLGEDPKTLVAKNLRRFKAYLETGEVPTVEGQPSGRDESARELHTH